MYIAVVFSPLLGAFLSGFFNHWLGNKGSQLVTCTGVALSAISAWAIAAQVYLGIVEKQTSIQLLQWIQSGSLDVTWALRFDTLTLVMLIVVSLVSLVVHIYSIGYMAKDPSIPRFMSYLSLFTFFMLFLVTSDNLVQMFFGWEGVGLASYLLIGFWYDRPSANAAAIKAFIVNRVGDLGFLLGIFATFSLFGTVYFDQIFATAAAHAEDHLLFLGIEWHTITVVCLLLFIGAMGKSAQLGLHTWLPDAMEGPTPVSALIHAATMVTAGVFMVTRMSPLFEQSEVALLFVAIVGAGTAFFAATVGCVQNDIKRVIAYSTCSQLGYMFFSIGVSAYQAAMFHLVTHAFFKALLFLSAGSVIHALSGEQDMRYMGGIAGRVKVTYTMMWIGSLALAGIPFFSGYWSKDMILEAVYSTTSSTSSSIIGSLIFWTGLFTAFLTAFYSWRLIFMTFHGNPRASKEVMTHIHESPTIMLAPLVILALGAVFSGWLNYEIFVGSYREMFWDQSIVTLGVHDTITAAHHHTPLWVKLSPLGFGLGGIFLAYILYILAPVIPAMLASIFSSLHRFLLNKWYFDELYDRLFTLPARSIGRALWLGGDEAVIDNIGPDGIAVLSQQIAQRFGYLQSGYIYHYAFTMVIGVTSLVTWFIFFYLG